MGLLRARALADRANHKLKAAQLLAGGGFGEEARAPALDAIRLTAGCLAASTMEAEPEDMDQADGVALNAVRALSGDTTEPDIVETAAVFLDDVPKRIFRNGGDALGTLKPVPSQGVVVSQGWWKIGELA